MADGHCLVNQTLAACGAKAGIQSTMQASTLETLVNLVAAGYGTTLIPALAEPGFTNRGVELRPLRQGATRIIRLASRPGFPRPQALRAIEKIVRRSVQKPGVNEKLANLKGYGLQPVHKPCRINRALAPEG